MATNKHIIDIQTKGAKKSEKQVEEGTRDKPIQHSDFSSRASSKGRLNNKNAKETRSTKMV